MMKLSLCLFAISLFAILNASECAEACQHSHDYWVEVAENISRDKGYYSGLADTNCWGRETIPAGEPDPCWKLAIDCPGTCTGAAGNACLAECNSQFQSCCLESAKINENLALDSCLAQCQNENVEEGCTKTCGPSEKLLQASCECVRAQGVFIKGMSGKVKLRNLITGELEDISPGTQLTENFKKIITGGDGEITIEIVGLDGKVTEVTLGPRQYFIPSVGDLIGANLLASSEHSSIRGTINGGGDFIFILTPMVVGGLPLDVRPPSATVNGSGLALYSELSDGYVWTYSEEEASYEIYDYDGTEITVISNSGSVSVGNNQTRVELKPGERTTASTSSISKPAKEDDTGSCNFSLGLILLPLFAFYTQQSRAY